MRVAIVTDVDSTDVINRFGQPCPKPPQPWPNWGTTRSVVSGTIRSVVSALQEVGPETLLCEGDKTLLATLEGFMPPDPQARPSGIVFNLAEGTPCHAGSGYA